MPVASEQVAGDPIPLTWLDKEDPALLTRLLSEVERMARNAA